MCDESNRRVGKRGKREYNNVRGHVWGRAEESNRGRERAKGETTEEVNLHTPTLPSSLNIQYQDRSDINNLNLKIDSATSFFFESET